jgi:ADP-heptose:LPS heptosyltransferase
MTPEQLAEAVRALRRLRRRLAPPGSLRERLLRLLYVPALGLVPRRWQLRLRRGRTMQPEVVFLEDLGVRDLRRRPIRDILVFKVDHIGDLIVGLPALRDLRDGFPEARITLVCASWNRAWAERLGWFDRIVPFDFFSPLNRDWAGTAKGLRALYDSVAALPLGACDLALDLRHDPDTRPCLYRIDAAFRAGFQAPAEPGLPCLDLAVPITEGVALGEDLVRSLHAQLRLQMLVAAVVAAFAPPRPHPARALLPPGGGPAARPFAVLAIGAGDPIRCWPIARYAEVGRALAARRGLDIVVLGGAAEREDAARLAAALPEARVRTVTGMPLAEVPALLAGAALCVCNGSGMSHLAASLDVPTVAILGGTTRMEVWHPAGANALSVGGRTPCQPCGLRQARDCPWDVACLTAVTVAHVLGACERLLA